MKDFRELCKAAHQTAVDHGWWKEAPSTETIICDIHGSIAGAWREHKQWGLDKDAMVGVQLDEFGTLKPDGLAVELADVVIRLMDWCGHEGWTLTWPDHDNPWTYWDTFPANIQGIFSLLGPMVECGTQTDDLLDAVVGLAAVHDIPLEQAIHEKMAYNETRPRSRC